MAKILRHPLVVGAALALLSGVLASLLIPALTRTWQDRPKELALKRTLVEQISESSSDAIDDAKFYLLVPDRGDVQKANKVMTRFLRRWHSDSSLATAELTTYFSGSAVLDNWLDYTMAVEAYAHASAFWRVNNKRAQGDLSQQAETLETFFRSWPSLPRKNLEGFRRFFEDGVPERVRFNALEYHVPLLLLAERDELAGQVVETPAAGFSHGFWIFK